MDKKNIIVLSIVVLIFTGIGLYLGMPEDKEITEEIEDSRVKATITDKESSARGPSSKGPSIPDQSKKTTKSYKEKLFSDPVVSSLKKRTKEIFKDYDFVEEISDWMALGFVMDSSREFGEIYLGRLKKLNRNPHDVLNALKTKSKGLGEKDSFIRNMFLNLAHNLKVSGKKKQEFFGGEFSRKVKFDEKGNFTEDSMNITNSMALFRQHTTSDKNALEYAKEAMEKNRDNPNAQKELLLRLKSYFPQIVDELERP